MNIAVVAPSPVPFSFGGLENLAEGLMHSINLHTKCSVELFKIPCAEGDFWQVLDSYEKLYRLNLDHFDTLVSFKYPTWMIRHHNHIVWMAHKLRGLYDTYSYFQLPTRVKKGSGVIIDRIIDITLSNTCDPKSVERLFSLFPELKQKAYSYPQEHFSFPGPLIRQIVHYLDNYALAPGRIKSYAAISNTVKNRKNYFPRNVSVKTIYPPSGMQSPGFGRYDYLFTASRLEAPKRVNLILEAMKQVKSPVSLLISGTGPEEDKLRLLAAKDSRVKFLGHTSINVLSGLYSNALAVPFVPFDEDLGLIAYEAMLCGKPVITLQDSGGPTELIQDGKNGFICRDVKDMADKIDLLYQNKRIAQDMGKLSFQVASGITWEGALKQLLGRSLTQQRAFSERAGKKRLLFLAPYQCYPPKNGGQGVIYNLLSELSSHLKITLLSMIEEKAAPFDINPLPELRLIGVPLSSRQAWLQHKTERILGLNTFDIACGKFSRHAHQYRQKLMDLVPETDLIVAVHPYLFNTARKAAPHLPVTYYALDFEYRQKKGCLDKSAAPHMTQKMLEYVKSAEKEAVSQSVGVWSTSREEISALSSFYSASQTGFQIVPNGISLREVEYVPIEERSKASISISQKPAALFLGSWHPPNLEALVFIIEKLAPVMLDVVFLVLGGVREYYHHSRGKEGAIPENVKMFGFVDEKKKSELSSLARVAINPIFSGSGTNIKVIEYMAAGLPVITTPFGARGFDNGERLIVAQPEDFPARIYHVINNTVDFKLDTILNRQVVEKYYDYSVIAERLAKHITGD
ncbi:MAG: glycosyltransferase [Desulfocucumaceae bacterium]